MEEFIKLNPEKAYPIYKKLHRQVVPLQKPHGGFSLFFNKLYGGQFKVLDRYNRTVYGYFKNQKAQALITHFKPKNGASPESLGALLISPDLTIEEIVSFQDFIRSQILPSDKKIIGPMNGHMHLGLSTPEHRTDPDKIAFLTSPVCEQTHRFFECGDLFNKEREFYSFSRPVESAQREFKTINDYIEKNPMPSEFSIRPLSLLNFKRDIRIFHDLLNQCFHGHYLFDPLDFNEEWDLMGSLLPFVNKKFFKFLTYKDREIAFSWFLPDYNTHLNSNSDSINLLKALSIKSKPHRVRGVYAGILPEFRGRGYMKWLRHSIYKEIFNSGVQVIENSYVDQANVNSAEYIKSSGHQLSHKYFMYSVSP